MKKHIKGGAKMSSTRESILNTAWNRGYEVVLHTADKKTYSLLHPELHFGLQLDVDTAEFTIFFMYGDLNLTTGNCKGFMNEGSFQALQGDMVKAAEKLTGVAS
jgi:hypothetical protein